MNKMELNLSVVPGTYVFNGKPMGEEEVQDFKDTYMKEIYSVYESLGAAKEIKNESRIKRSNRLF